MYIFILLSTFIRGRFSIRFSSDAFEDYFDFQLHVNEKSLREAGNLRAAKVFKSEEQVYQRNGIDNDDRRINEDNCTLNSLKDGVTRQISRVAIIDIQLLAR